MLVSRSWTEADQTIEQIVPSRLSRSKKRRESLSRSQAKKKKKKKAITVAKRCFPKSAMLSDTACMFAQGTPVLLIC